MRALASTLAISLGLAACESTGDDAGTVEVDLSTETGGKADASGEVRLRAGETTVWVTSPLVRRTDATGQAHYVLRGRTSRNLEGGNGYIIDDPYGEFAQQTARTWEVTWATNLVRTLADGTNQFVALNFVHSSGRPDALTLRAQVRPRLLSFAGSSKIYVTAELTPVVVDGTTVYRLKAKVTGGYQRVEVSVPGTITRLSASELVIDLPPAQIASDAPIVVSATLANGSVVTKTVTLGLAVTKLGLTDGDAYEQWPNPTCTAATKTCLTNLGASALDTAACGEALQTLACASSVGVRVDDVAFQAALAASHARTSSPAFRADAASLVGADRVEQLQGGAEQTIEARLERLLGRWYLGAPARTSSLTTAVDAAIAQVYAHPLDLVAPHDPLPGDVAATRQVAADALLAHLATMNFAPLGRSYDELVAGARANHVASLGELRTTAVVEPFAGTATLDVLTGAWLGLHTEITIDRASGMATNVLVEID